MKTTKIILRIIHFIYIDDFRYFPLKWNFPLSYSKFKEQYHKIRPTLLMWEQKGYITLVEDDEVIFVIHPEKLPSKEELIEESKNHIQNGNGQME